MLRKKIRYLLIIFFSILTIAFIKNKLFRKETENMEKPNLVSNIVYNTPIKQNSIRKCNTQPKEVFTSSEFPNQILKKMIGNSIPSKDKIDINPLYNPYVVKGNVLPTKGKQYANRNIIRKGTIQRGYALYNAFSSNRYIL